MGTCRKHASSSFANPPFIFRHSSFNGMLAPLGLESSPMTTYMDGFLQKACFFIHRHTSFNDMLVAVSWGSHDGVDGYLQKSILLQLIATPFSSPLVLTSPP